MAMKPGGGKAKGSGFEGQLAKKLSAALTPLNFIRTQGSGARVGGKNFQTIGAMFGEDALKLFVGDVVPVNEKDTGLTFKYSVEAKFYKTPDNFTSLVSGTANVYGWFEESVTDAVKINKIPMLVFKWNRTAIFVIIEKTDDVLPVQPKFELVQNRHLQVFLLDDLLEHPAFWAS
jgi:hypothetical protein